ncbi:MAG: hypothetical protein FWG21_03720 [Oscillospiraceae bacterium]|nr:hypothetical protein [Oscillospiraceae bacterium]
MIKIAHVYNNLLNLYGSWGNLAVLERYLTESGYEVSLNSFSVGGYSNLSDYDLIYLGAGTESRMLQALSDFKRFHADIKQYLKDDRKILATGNSMAILGEKVTDDGSVYEGASVIDISTVIGSNRNYSELILSSRLNDHPVIGNINSSITITYGKDPVFFDILSQSVGNRKQEGVQKGSIYATELSGPLLVRNPYLLHSFCEVLVEKALPMNTNEWFATALNGYSSSLATLKKQLKHH